MRQLERELDEGIDIYPGIELGVGFASEGVTSSRSLEIYHLCQKIKFLFWPFYHICLDGKTKDQLIKTMNKPYISIHISVHSQPRSGNGSSVPDRWVTAYIFTYVTLCHR